MLGAIEVSPKINLSIGNNHALLRRKSPFHIAVSNELRGEYEEIALLERCFESRRAQGYKFRTQFRKTLVASDGRRRMAQLAGISFDHLPVGHADRHHLMEG